MRQWIDFLIMLIICALVTAPVMLAGIELDKQKCAALHQPYNWLFECHK